MRSRPTHSIWPALVLCVLAVGVSPLASSAASEQAPALTAPAPLDFALAPDPSQGRFSLDFIATDLVDVIKALAQQSGANIAVSGQVEGQITLHLSNVTLEQALTIVTKLGGVDYAKVDSTYVVGNSQEVSALKAASYTSRVVSLQHISADYAKETLGRVAPDVTVSAQPGTRALVLVGPAGDLSRCQQVLAEVDVAAPPAPPVTEIVTLQYAGVDEAVVAVNDAALGVQASQGPSGTLLLNGNGADVAAAKALIAAFDVAPAMGVAERLVYTVKYAEPEELAETLTSLLPGLQVTPGPRTITPFVTPPAGGAAGGMSGLSGLMAGAGLAAPSGAAAAVEAAAPVTTLILSGSKSLLERAKQLLAEIDKPPGQLRVKVTITEVSEDAEKRLGINWQDLAGAAGMILTEGFDSGDVVTETPTARSIRLGHLRRSHLQITGALNALVTEGKAQILANPTVAMLDGREATIHSGEKIYYPQVVGYTPLGGQIVQATEIDVGIQLKVTPRIGPDGMVTLTVLPSISSIAPSVFSGYPTITQRAAVTTVRVQDGGTFALGGLIHDEETITVNKVPLLGDLPVLGKLLFRSTNRKPSHTEILVIITPEIVKDGE